MSKDRKNQENSRNYVTWGMLRGLKMFILVEELRKFKLILNTKGNYFLVEEIYSIKFQTWLEPVWRRAGINQVKHILRSMAATHGMWHPLCECHPCHWITWSRVVGKMYPNPGCLDPQCSWVSRSIWMQRNEGENQNNGAALFPQMTVFLFVFSIKFFFSQVAKGMSWTGMKKIFNHILCFDNIILGSENKE